MMSENRKINGKRRSTFGLILTVIGFVLFLMGTSPELFGLDRSPVIGFVQISVFLFGLGVICLGGYVSLISLWSGKQKSIGADIGVRLIATGYVIALASGMADVFGFGNQPWPAVPVFGRWQSRGVLIGEIVIAIGFLLLLPPASAKKIKGTDSEDLESK
jgi:uncharacterized membrane protein (DUF485 family)